VASVGERRVLRIEVPTLILLLAGGGASSPSIGRQKRRRGVSPASAASATAGQVGERSSGSSESEMLDWGCATRDREDDVIGGDYMQVRRRGV
jgi:hypothetical protein